MSILANIGGFLFGGYSHDLGINYQADKVSNRIAQNPNDIGNILAKKGNVRALGDRLNLTPQEIQNILRQSKSDRLTALTNAANLNGQTGLLDRLKSDLSTKYNGVDFKQVSFWDRLKANYSAATEKDVVYRLFKGDLKASDFFKEIKTGINQAGPGLLPKAGAFLTKSMPIIGSLISLGIEVPAIFKSFKNYDTEEGLKQTGRAAFSLGGFAAGAAAGAAIGSAVPIVGTLIGGALGSLAGGFLGKTVLGKSKVETQSEIEALGVPADQAQALVKQGLSAEEVEQTVAAQKQQQQETTQTNPFATADAKTQQEITQTNPSQAFRANSAYSATGNTPTSLWNVFSTGNNGFMGNSYPTGGISLGDEGSNTWNLYKYGF